MMKKHQSTRDQISEIGPCDVLLGRGTGPNENQGNKMFRDILRKYKEAYWVAETKKDKRDVVAKAIDEFHAGGGRFVEKVVLTSDHCPGKNCYEIVEGPAVFLKARQAFRYLLRGSEAEDQKDKPSVGEPEMSTLPSQASRGTSLSLVEESREPPAASPNLQARGPISPNVKEEEIEEFTLRNAIDLQRLASLAADAPPLLTSLQNSPYLNSPWRQHELSSPAVRRMSDIMLGRTNLLMNSMRYPGSFTWPQDSNTHVNQRIANSDLRVGGEQYSLLSSLSPFEMRPTLHDTGWDRLLSPSSDYLRYHQLIHGQESRIIQQCAIEQALLEQHRQQKRLTDLLAPNLEAMISAKASLPLQQEQEKSRLALEHEHQRQASLHRIMAALPGDRNLFADGQPTGSFTPRAGPPS